jgi:hypothetical protein
VKGGYSKFRNQKTTIGSITFDSKLEEQRYIQLKNNPAVKDIQVHPVFEVFPATKKKIDGKIVTFQKISYIADFMVFYHDGRITVEDVKGVETEAFRLKRKLFEAAYPDLTLRIVRYQDIKEEKKNGVMS